jgi:hypothetical protein
VRRCAGQNPALAVVPDAVIDDIRRRERDGVIELRRLRTGSRVGILGGPFRDHLGLCTGMTGRERVTRPAQRALGATPGAAEPGCDRAGLTQG